MQTCDPRLITRPDVFAYGRAIPEVAGWYDYRICYRQSATERLRTLQALSWSWRPYSCAMRPIDGAAFDAWLGKRTLLFLGDSLNAQMYYSLSWLLGDSIAEHKDLFGYETPGANRTERKMDTCTTGVGNEGGWLSTATLRGGGRLVKVMRHGDLIDEMKRMEKAFWAPWLQEADIVVLNVGHHYHSKDPTFGKYPRLVRTTMNQLGKLIKPSAQLIYRTTNVGHHKCENASRPLRSRLLQHLGVARGAGRALGCCCRGSACCTRSAGSGGGGGQLGGASCTGLALRALLGGLDLALGLLRRLALLGVAPLALVERADLGLQRALALGVALGLERREARLELGLRLAGGARLGLGAGAGLALLGRLDGRRQADECHALPHRCCVPVVGPRRRRDRLRSAVLQRFPRHQVAA